jgi:2,4-dienoyl-CoA reductase [(3E)-enoyl-CoA-producing], peroxisomal
MHGANLSDCVPAHASTVMDIDALGTFTVSRAAYPALAAAATETGGLPCIINISATLHYGATWWQV